MPEQVSIGLPEPGEEAEIESVVTAHFSPGASYDVSLGLDDPHHHVRVARADGEILGVSAVELFDTAEAVADAMYFFDDPDPIPAADRYGLAGMGYVRPDATGRGIGGRLLDRIHDIGVDHGVDCFLADSWFHDGDDSPRYMLDSRGYETILTDPLHRPAADCPKCRDTCRCSGAMAVRWVE